MFLLIISWILTVANC